MGLSRTNLAFFPNIVVWGDDHVNSFLSTAVPTILAPGNLEALKDFEGSAFIIVCPRRERGIIEASAGFHRIQQQLSVRFIDLDWDMKSKSHAILNLSEGHRRICREVAERAGFSIFLSPDCLLSAHAFRYLVDQARAGKRAVAAPGFRLIKERVEAEYEGLKCDGVVNISGRGLFRMFLEHRHPEMDGYFVCSRHFTRYPHYCFWPLKSSEAMLVRAFHLHPIMVHIPTDAYLDTLDHDTIDGDFVGRLVGDFDSVKVVRDVDDLTIFSLSPRNALLGKKIKHSYIPSHVAHWAFSSLNKAIHRYYFTQPIVMHTGEVNRAEVAELIERSGREAHEILHNPLPIRYVGFSDHVNPQTSNNAIATRDLLSELRWRVKSATWTQRFKGLKHLLGLE